MSNHSKRGKGRRRDGGGVKEGAAVWCCAAGVERQRGMKECFQRHWFLSCDSFTDLPSHSVLGAERCAFSTPLPAAVRLCYGCDFIKDELGGTSR